MSAKTMIEKGSLHMILRVLGAWLFSAAVLTILASFILWRAGLSDHAYGYISSAISFLSAVVAGGTAIKGREQTGALSALIAACALTILLLTVGFLVSKENLSSDGIMSLVSFTFAGILLGYVVFPKGKKITNKKRIIPRKRK